MSWLRPSSGFHPSFVSCLPLPPLPSSCSFHVLYSLPPHIFVDPNELTGDHDLRTAVDLEAPVFNVDQRPTHVLHNITESTAHFHPNGTVCFSLPIHARYGTPSTSCLRPLSIDCPCVFSSCPRSYDSQATLEVDGVASFLRTEDITLRVFQQSTYCAVSLLLPVGDPSVLKDVQLGTALVLLSAAVYCLSAFIKASRRLRAQRIVYKED